MKAEIVQLSTGNIDFPEDIGWITVKFIPETEEEKKMVAAIAKSHNQLAREESSDAEIANIGSITSGPGEIEMEIFFPKSIAPVATQKR